jgi:hypothetical protein
MPAFFQLIAQMQSFAYVLPLAGVRRRALDCPESRVTALTRQQRAAAPAHPARGKERGVLRHMSLDRLYSMMDFKNRDKASENNITGLEDQMTRQI